MLFRSVLNVRQGQSQERQAVVDHQVQALAVVHHTAAILVEAVLEVEIVLDNEQLPSPASSNVLVYSANGDGGNSYTISDLAGNSILMVFTGGILRNSSDYTFTQGTGTIVFIGEIDADVTIQILYSEN